LGIPPLAFALLLLLILQILVLFFIYYRFINHSSGRKETTPEIIIPDEAPSEDSTVENLSLEQVVELDLPTEELPKPAEEETIIQKESKTEDPETSIAVPDTQEQSKDDDELYNFKVTKIASIKNTKTADIPEPNEEIITNTLESIPDELYNKQKKKTIPELQTLIDDVSASEDIKTADKEDLLYLIKLIQKHGSDFTERSDNITTIENIATSYSIPGIMILNKIENKYKPFQHKNFDKITLQNFSLESNSVFITKYLNKNKAVILQDELKQSIFLEDKISKQDYENLRNVIFIPILKKRKIELIIVLTNVMK
jgi:hypothetical protein